MKSVFNHYFYPDSICIVGASSKPKSLGYELTKSVKQYGYTGDLALVNPKADEILGYKCYPSISSIDYQINLEIVMVPKKFVEETIKELTRKRFKQSFL